jgi:hypothetical protein
MAQRLTNVMLAYQKTYAKKLFQNSASEPY